MKITGKKSGSKGKVPMALVDPMFIEALARVLEAGEHKHGDVDSVHHWMRGMAYEDVISGIERHLGKIKAGEDIDPEFGLPHAAHAAAGLMYLDWYRENGMENSCDNRRYKQRATGEKVSGDMRAELQYRGVLPVSRSEVRLDLSPVQLQGEAGTWGEQVGAATDEIVHLQDRIERWANRVLPERTVMGAVSKLMIEELPELMRRMDDPDEYADCLILFLDIARMMGVDPVAAAHAKMDVNESSEWVKDPQTGFMKRVKPRTER